MVRRLLDTALMAVAAAALAPVALSVSPTYSVHCVEILQCPADRGRELRELRGDGLTLALQCLDDRVAGEQPGLGHLAQLARSDAQAVRKRARKPRGLLHDGIEFVAAQRAAPAGPAPAA